MERIKIWCGECYLDEKEVLEVVAMNSPKNFYELKIHNRPGSALLPEDLESFFVSWKDRIQRKPLSLIIIDDDDLDPFTMRKKTIRPIL